MPVVVDLEGIRTSLDLVPDGVYDARLTKTTFGKSKAGFPKVSLEFVFNEDTPEEVAGRKAFVEASLQAQALFKVKAILIDLGYDPEALEGKVDLEAAFGDMAGAEATIKVGHHEYQGVMHNDFYVVSPDASNAWASDTQ